MVDAESMVCLECNLVSDKCSIFIAIPVLVFVEHVKHHEKENTAKVIYLSNS